MNWQLNKIGFVLIYCFALILGLTLIATTANAHESQQNRPPSNIKIRPTSRPAVRPTPRPATRPRPTTRPNTYRQTPKTTSKLKMDVDLRGVSAADVLGELNFVVAGGGGTSDIFCDDSYNFSFVEPTVFGQGYDRRSLGVSSEQLLLFSNSDPAYIYSELGLWDSIRAQAAAGVREIEVGSFVPPKVLPQMADTAEVVRAALEIDGLTVAVLVPNLRGAENAIKAGAHKISIPFSVSETHSLKNVRRNHDQMIDEVRSIAALVAEQANPPHFEAGLSTAFGCTIEGAIDEDVVARLAPVVDFFAIGDEIWREDDAVAALTRLTARM